MSRPDESHLRTRLLRRAMLRPEAYLAAALAEWPDEDLAAMTGADAAKVWQLRTCGWPRPERWSEDIAQMAELVGADTARLAQLLVHLGVRPR